MNRQIKFRGKRIDNGEWVYGYITHLSGMPKECIKQDGYYISDEQGRQPVHLVGEDTVGQFTGLCDKNGKEIYERDIVKYQLFQNWDDDGEMKRHTGIIGFGRKPCTVGCFDIEMKIEGKNSAYHHADDFIPLKETCCMWGLEVIGNIHDNPDLLTTK